MKERSGAIDVARGIALFFVVLGHLVSSKSNTFNWIFSFHMPIFFFLSGMCFNFDKYSNFLEFIKEKFKKRIIPYIGFVLLAIAICLAVPGWRLELEKTRALSLLEETFYYTQPEKLHIGQTWFLVALFWAEIILYWVFKLFKKYNRNQFLLIGTYAILAIIGSKILDIAEFIKIVRFPFKIDSAIIASVIMGLGYEVKKHKVLEKFNENKFFYIPIFIGVGFLIGQHNGYVNICDCEYKNIIFYLISGLCGIAGIYLISEKIEKNKVLQFYGRNSLFMFAIHSMLICVFTFLLNLIYERKIIAMKNIPIWLCVVGAIGIYAILYPMTIIYNKIKNKIKNDKLQIPAKNEV